MRPSKALLLAAAAAVALSGLAPAAAEPTSPDLTIVKTPGASSFAVGTPATYALEVRNTGTAPSILLLAVTDHVPVGLTYTESGGAGWTRGTGPWRSPASASRS